jgi:thioredoxin 1
LLTWWGIYHLATNDYLVSASGLYFVIMQGDGNLCIYHGSDPAHQGAFVWNSGKAPGAGVYGATMQNDGNLVVTTGTTVLWSAQHLSTSTQPTGGHPNLIHVGDQDFQSKVLSSQMAVIVDFWAQWAGPCLSIAPVFERLSDAYQGELLFAKLDIDENEQTPMRYNIQSIPTFVIFKGGQEIARIVDPEPARLQSLIDRAITT